MEVDEIVAKIEKEMRALDRKARRCEKQGEHQWVTLCYGRILGLLDARNFILEAVKEKSVGTN